MTKISFPLMASYNIPAYYLLSHITKKQIISPPPITKKTIDLGSKYAPEFICTPFKYTLGTMIEAVNMGADELIQMGGGCRYGYYAYLQDKIIKDLGYDVKVFNLVTGGKINFKKIYKTLKEIDPKIKLIKIIYYGIITIKMVKYMDKIDDYIRCNKAFEIEKGSFDNLRKMMHKEFLKVKNLYELHKTYKKYLNKIKNVKIHKPDKYLKVGIIGELYTVMDPFANNYLEDELAKANISVKRFTTVTYLLFKKAKFIKKALKKIKIIKYQLGADAADNIIHTKWLCDHDYDGIIHIKSAFCTPEIGAMPIINKIAEENDVPVLFLTFEANTSDVGLKTRLEAFFDMLEVRK